MDYAPLPFSLRQLQYVVAVAETLSFRKAAERCRVAQPSLSTQLALVEEALGVPLFERSRRKVLTTEAGKLLVARAERVLLEAADLVAAARRVGDPLHGTLRIGVIPTISPYLLPSLTPALRKAFPHLSLFWVEDKTEVLVARLDAGALDAALLAIEADIGDVEQEIIAKDPFMLVLPQGHPLTKSTAPADAGTLRGEEVLLLTDGHCFRNQALEVCSTARARELEFRATSLSTLVQMVDAGLGITLLPALAVPAETARARLVIRPFAAPPPFRTIALVWRKRSPLGETFGLVAKELRRVYPDVYPTRAKVKKGQTLARGAKKR